jgi:RNA polymerase sigma factor (sigma-70 family)
MSTTPISLLERLGDHPDAGAWREFVDLYTPLLTRWLRRYSLESHDAEDLVQEVLGVVVRQLPQFRHNRQAGAFRRWLRTITANCLRKFWRTERTRPRSAGGDDFAAMLDQLEDPGSDLSRLWDREHDRHVVEGLLRRIGADFAATTWKAFRGHVVEDRPAGEVAAELALSVNAVVIAKSRVLRRLREVARGLID